MPDASTPAATPQASAAPAMLRAAWKDIHRSPLNPRKNFEAETLQELAGNIAVHGILQNLVVRPHPKKTGEYELVAGERRHRAYELLIKAGKAKAEDQLPVQIRKLDDKEASLVALTENVARNELTASEEAEAFTELKKLGMLPAEIGLRIGKTERFVQKRIRLKRDLTPAAWKALVAGELSVEQANAIAMAPAEEQETLVDDAKPLEGARGDSAEDLLQRVTNKLVPVGDQCFPVESYTGTFVERDGLPEMPDAPTRWFTDTKQVQTLAKKALEAEKAKLAKKYPFVEIKKVSHGTQCPWDWNKAPAGNAKAGALIVYHAATAAFEVHAPVLKPQPRQSSGSSSSGSGKPAAPPTHDWNLIRYKRAHASKAIMSALVANPALTTRFAAMTAIDNVEQWDLAHVCEALRDRWNELTGKLAKLDKAALWKALAKLDAKTLGEINALRHLIVADGEDFVREASPGNKPPGIEAWAAPIVAETKATPSMTWEFYGKNADEFLAACGPAQLLRIAQDLNIAVPAGDDPKALLATITKQVAANRKYMPPWLQLETSDEIAKRLKAAPAKKKG